MLLHTRRCKMALRRRFERDTGDAENKHFSSPPSEQPQPVDLGDDPCPETGLFAEAVHSLLWGGVRVSAAFVEVKKNP